MRLGFGLGLSHGAAGGGGSPAAPKADSTLVTADTTTFRADQTI